MRRVTPASERGSVTVFVVLIMPMLVLFGAFVFDGGRGIVARSETQNAADAGALAKATDCANDIATTDVAPYQTNGVTLRVDTPVCDASSGVTVSGTKTVNRLFSDPFRPSDVTRSATAKWGNLASAATLPIVIADCEFSPGLLDGTADVLLYLDDPKPQSGCSSLPGGFSQLVDDDCQITIGAGGLAEGDAGGDIQKIVPCITNATGAALPKDVLVPMYDAAACAATCKGKGPYKILGFAMLRVTGYSFNGNFNGGGMDKKCPDDKNRGRYCLRGDFVRFVVSQGTPGPSTDFGVRQVFLVS